MSALEAVREIRERSMGRMRAEPDADAAIAYALAGLWDAVEVLSQALDDHDDPVARHDLERLVRSLPVRLASVDRDGVATAAVTEHLAAVLHMPSLARRERGSVERVGGRRCGAWGLRMSAVPDALP